jgi:pimeloyl-ACP methyl ester carboxylesterase
MSIASIDVGGISCQYSAVGAGEPIVLLHCTGHSGRQWAELAAAFRTDFEVIAPDLCGYGGTAHWPKPFWQAVRITHVWSPLR